VKLGGPKVHFILFLMANIYSGEKTVSYVRVRYILQGFMWNYVRDV